MKNDLQEKATGASHEAVHAARDAQQAVEIARDAQMEAVFDRAFKKAFTLDDGVTRRFVDVSRANLICQTVVGIESRLQNIEGNITWGVRIFIGAIITGLVMVVFSIFK